MEAKAVQRLQFPTMVYSEKLGRTGPSGSLRVSRHGVMEPKKLQAFVSAARPSTKSRRRMVSLEVACSYDNVPGCISIKSYSYF